MFDCGPVLRIVMYLSVPGQGYLWMGHKSPDGDIWELALRSHRLWESLAESLRDQGLNPSEELGWKKTGKSNNDGIATRDHDTCIGQ